MFTQIFYSSIRPELKWTMLRRGSVFGVLGVAIFLFMGTALSTDALKFWGIPGFFASGALITLGLRPYRRLATLETCPHYIIIEQSGVIEFAYAGKPFLAFASKNIRELHYRNVLDSYGVVINLKNVDAVQTLHAGLDLGEYIQSIRTRYGGDLFLPFFSQRLEPRLQDIMHLDEAE